MWLTHFIRRSLSRPYALPMHTNGVEFASMALGAMIRETRARLRLYDPITRLAAKHKSDKGVTVYPFHGYSVYYARLFESLRDHPINILEIGLSKPADRKSLGVTCPSLSMWLEYFPKAKAYGFDIDDFSQVTMPRTRIFRGDQGKAEDLLRVAAQCSKFDIIIDDGSHAAYHQQVTLKTLFPYLASGGLYVIEDLNSQPIEIESRLPRASKTKDLLKDRDAVNQMIAGVKDILFFDSPMSAQEGALAVIVKN